MKKLYLIFVVQVIMVCNALALGWSINYLDNNTIEFYKSTTDPSLTSVDVDAQLTELTPFIHQLLYPLTPC